MINKKLIIFDIDGTLADRDTSELLPGVREFFTQLAKQESGPQVALASNQGGVGYRYWLESLDPRPDWAKPEDYPTQRQAEAHIGKVAREIGELYMYPEIFVSFAYRFKNSGEWAPTPYDGRQAPLAWRRDWRKPAPGMLLQAMQDHNASPVETLMVGDRDEDEGAAKAAGCAYGIFDDCPECDADGTLLCTDTPGEYEIHYSCAACHWQGGDSYLDVYGPMSVPWGGV